LAGQNDDLAPSLKRQISEWVPFFAVTSEAFEMAELPIPRPQITALSNVLSLISFDDGGWREPLAAQSAKLVTAGFLAALMAGQATLAAAQPITAVPDTEPTVTGLWQKVDDSGNTVGWFVFVERNDHYEGAIAKTFYGPADPQNPVCSRCRDDRKDEPMLGLPLIRDMRRIGLVYEGGNILDPRDGNTYSAKMTVSPDGQTLIVRGFLGISLFGRDEVWHRLPDSAVKELDPVVIARYLPGAVPTGHHATAARHTEKTAKSGNDLR
jgi:uncharacterized protein (DUF2147 family)